MINNNRDIAPDLHEISPSKHLWTDSYTIEGHTSTRRHWFFPWSFACHSGACEIGATRVMPQNPQIAAEFQETSQYSRLMVWTPSQISGNLSTLSIEHMGQYGSTKPNEVQLDNQHDLTFAKPSDISLIPIKGSQLDPNHFKGGAVQSQSNESTRDWRAAQLKRSANEFCPKWECP